uniref:Cdc91 cell division cycle 91 1 n=1 Tax=Echinococcus granulosus TaxID=6210 RepID=A0A068WJY8_ECHGR|nr:cdc91 cell division cycle 91 1 [Echinococcus granulosus]
MSRYFVEYFTVGILLRLLCLNFAPLPVLQSIGHAANEDWSRRNICSILISRLVKEEVTIFRNPNVINGSPAIAQALECLGFLVFLSFDSVKVGARIPLCAYPLSVFVFAFNPFSVFAFGNHSVGIVPVILTALIFIALAKDRTLIASVLCGVGSYINIYPSYLMLAVLAQCRNCKSRVFSSLIAFTLTLAGLLFSTYYFENSWSFLRYCYISNIYARNTTPNLGLFWYMYVEMFAHFNVFFVWTMQLIIFGLCFGLLFRFYEDPLFLALLLTMTTGVLRPYNSVADLGCSLALLMHWRHIFIYFKNTFILSVLAAVALILAPLFYLTWLHTGTSNANFYFSASLIIGIVRVQLLIQTISAYLRYQFHQKFGPQPCLSTGTKIVPCIRS